MFMTNRTDKPRNWTLVQDAAGLAWVLEQVRTAEAVGVDVEGNGLFAYRARICTVQLAWDQGEQTKIAVIDALHVNVAALADLFGATSPRKVLHDLTFDARMLHDHGVDLQHVRDTSVAARLLGAKSTGLAAVLESELGIVLDKRHQQHDWSRRPLDPTHLEYLSNDVAHLLQLERTLMRKVIAQDIAAEIEAECAYKLHAALAPPRDQRPAYARIKGVHRLDSIGRAVLMQLSAVREEIAEAIDVPPFKVISNEILLEFARKRPQSVDDLGRIRGALSGRAGRYATRWLNAIRSGIEAGDVPASDRAYFVQPYFDRAAIAKRREIELKLSAFRRAEAERRGVNEQVVLPGHCLHDLAALLQTQMQTTTPGDPDAVAKIASIAGIGAKRAEHYAPALVALVEAPTNTDETMFNQDNLSDEAFV